LSTQTNSANTEPSIKDGSLSEVGLALGVFGLLLVMVVPLPPMLLDVLLAGSISLALLLFLGVLYVMRPVDFSVFPILLLIATVFRLALNVASTRLILLNGSESPAAAGHVIEAFGQFVVGGNYAVGFVVFSILVLINFVVITKGAGRVAEVGARFTLDAMPGKQMAVDAELNAGLIDETTARKRRSLISTEADFYGAMDGASKFIRGDAIAGIFITLINVVGGVFIGVVQLGMPFQDALHNYTILTIGDGLVGQIPALIVSMAAGLLVTRVQGDAESGPLHRQLTDQLFGNPRVLAILTISLAAFMLVPGLRLPFFMMAVIAGVMAWRGSARFKTKEKPKPSASIKPPQVQPEDLLPVEPLAVEVGMDLIYLIDDRKGRDLVERIQRTRQQFATDIGVVLPAVNLRDNHRLDSNGYQILLRGEVIGSGNLTPRQHLALDPGTTRGDLRGIKVTDPVFSMPAYWIPESGITDAQAKGFTVVDVPTIMTTHFVELMHTYAHELYDGPQLTDTLERTRTHSPRLVEDLVPDRLSRVALLKVMRNLISEGVSSRDAQTILEALGDNVGRTTDPDILTEFVRQRLSRHITHRFADPEGTVHYIAFAADAESALLSGLQSRDSQAPSLVLEPATARIMLTKIKTLTASFSGSSEAVVLAPPLARGALRRMLQRLLPRVIVLSSAELLPSVNLNRVGTISLQQGSKA
jgi:flagellar biosynthesis protein FlhA